MLLRNLARTFKVSRTVSYSTGRQFSTNNSGNNSGSIFGRVIVGSLLFSSGLWLGNVIDFDSKTSQENVSASQKTVNSSQKSVLPLEDVDNLQFANDQEFKKAIIQMKQIVGDDNFSESQTELEAAADLFFSTHRPPDPKNNRPSIILYPKNTTEVSEVVKVAHQYGVPIVANSGMTSLEGHTMHTRGPNSVSISFMRMNEIIEFHPDDLDVVVQPAVGWQDLDEFLQSREDGKRLCFGPDPGMGATIAGMASSSASGTNAYRYGTMKENVINMTVVLADGTILKTKQRPRKSSAGYDLTRLFIGQEGTLGLITELTVKLNVRPMYEYVSIATFPTIKDATQTASNIVGKSGIQLNAIELLDSTMVSFVNQHTTSDDPDEPTKQFIESPTLLMKIGGPTKQSINQDTAIIKLIAQHNHLIKFETSQNEEENVLLWGARRNGLWSTIDHGSKVLDDPDDVQVWTTDIAVPLSCLPLVISETNEDLNELGFRNKFATMGHIGDGNCHFLLLYNKKDYRKAQILVDRMVKRALKYEGTCTGEHGVGVGKRKFLPLELGQNSVDLMRRLKLLLDPKGILNPDKIVKLERGDNLDELLEKGVIREVGGGCG